MKIQVKKVKISSLQLLIVSLVAPFLSAAPVASFNFTGSTGANSAALLPGIESISAMVIGNPTANTNAGFSRTGSGAVWSERLGFTLNAAQSSTFAGAITAGDYAGFTIEVLPGYTLNLTTVSFDFLGQDNSGATTADFDARIGLWVNDFGANTDIKTQQFLGTIPNEGMLDQARSGAITGATGLTGTVELRFYFNQSSGATTTFSNVGMDNISISGAVIPEPSSVALMLIGLISAAGLFRRTRR